MFDQLQGLGYTIVALAIIIVIGSVIMVNLGNAGLSCPSTFSANSTDLCSNGTDVAVPIDGFDINVTAGYMVNQLGSSSGLASWVPAIIALLIGTLFLAAFMGRKGGKM